MLKSVFNNVADLQLSCESCKIFKNSFFHKRPPVAASEKIINIPGKHQWKRLLKFIFLIYYNVVDISDFYINLSNN